MNEERTDGMTLALLRDACTPTSEAFPDSYGQEINDLRAMRTLGRVLTCDAEIRVKPPKPPRGGNRARVRARRVPRAAAVAVPGAVIAVVAVVLAAALLTSSPSALAQKFPVFASASVSPVRAALGIFRPTGVRASAFRAVHTPYGTGYVTVSTSDRELCIGVPGSALALNLATTEPMNLSGHHVRYVGGCVSISAAERRGAVLTSPTTHGRVELVIVLPAKATRPVVHARSGRAKLLDVSDGTVASVVNAPGLVEYSVNGKRVSFVIERSAAKPYTIGTLTQEH